MLKTKFKKSKIKASQKGFTLVELMVVVGIIGILASIAVPQFQIYQAKARTSEAKLGLASLYSAQVAFQMEADAYATCLYDMGFRPAGTTAWAAITAVQSGQTERYYTIGFNADSTSALSVSSSACNVDRRLYKGTKSGNAVTALPQAVSPLAATPNAFTAQAIGTVDTADANVGNAGGTQGDSWTINENKELEHHRIGY